MVVLLLAKQIWMNLPWGTLEVCRHIREYDLENLDLLQCGKLGCIWTGGQSMEFNSKNGGQYRRQQVSFTCCRW